MPSLIASDFRSESRDSHRIGEVVPVDWLFVELFCPYCKPFICNKLQEMKALAKQPPHAFPRRWVEFVAAAR